MSMNDDWLDRRLAAESYLPDNGFTGCVMGRLPQVRRRVFSLRSRILACSGLLAFCLFLFQFVPAIRMTQQLLSTSSTKTWLTHLATDLQQPFVFCGVAVVAALLGFGALRFLERLD